MRHDFATLLLIAAVLVFSASVAAAAMCGVLGKRHLAAVNLACAIVNGVLLAVIWSMTPR
jgi:hypothetical protein